MPYLPPTFSGISATQPLAHEAARLPYLPAVPLPDQLREHCKIYLEEKLYTQALTLLHNILTASISTSSPVQTPPPSILSLLWTLAIHPYFTNLPPSQLASDKAQTTNLALHYLILLNITVGPINAHLNEALKFREQSRRGARSRRRNDHGYGGEQSEDEDETDELNGRFANEESLATRGQDFWRILGWTLNCAAVHKRRWLRWKLHMQFLARVLEDDWAERLRLFEEAKAAGQTKLEAESVLAESVIVMYIGGAEAVRQGGLRRMMKSVFANGSQDHLSEFGEVFLCETKEAKEKVLLSVNAKQMNIEEGDFGDYFDSSDDAEAGVDEVVAKQEPGTGLKRSRRSGNAGGKRTRTSDAEVLDKDRRDYGDHEAIQLRKQVLGLLFKVASTLPAHFTGHDALVDVCEEFMRPLPLPVFAAMISNASLGVPSSHISLLQEIARPLLASSGAPIVKSYHLTQAVLESSYLPFASGSDKVLVDNTRLTLCLEGMVRLLDSEIGMSANGNKLRKAVEQGMEARRTAVDATCSTMSPKAKESDEHKEVKAWLESTEMRLNTSLSLIERE